MNEKIHSANNLSRISLQNAMQSGQTATQVQKCVSVFAHSNHRVSCETKFIA